MYTRLLNLPKLLEKKSFFLFGPRGVGKSFLIKQSFNPSVPVFNLLDTDVFTHIARRPKRLSEELKPQDTLVVIDEIQKLPRLLDEVHRLVEERGIRFLLTGSSARKLKRGGANLLGGRAWEAGLHPLTTQEIPDFDLITYLNRGGIPYIYPSKDFEEELDAYVGLYVLEEIQAEALSRKIDQFLRFLDVIALQNGEEMNYQQISSDAEVPPRTLQNYVQVLIDTLMGFELPAFRKTKTRKAIARSKFYFFDVGIVNALCKRHNVQFGSELFGRAFEHFLIQEVRAYLSYCRIRKPMTYWRSTSQFEVDCVVGQDLAFEVKATSSVHPRHLKGLKALKEEGMIQRYAIVSQDPVFRTVDGIEHHPWFDFLKRLWKGEFI